MPYARSVHPQNAIAGPARAAPARVRVAADIEGGSMIRRLYALRGWMISLITVGTILNYMTRTMLGVAAPTLMGDLGITEKEYSWVTGFFQAGIMLQPLAGYVMDSIGLKLGFGLFALAWAVLMMLHGAAANWPMLAALRGLMGVAEGSA